MLNGGRTEPTRKIIARCAGSKFQKLQRLKKI